MECCRRRGGICFKFTHWARRRGGGTCGVRSNKLSVQCQSQTFAACSDGKPVWNRGGRWDYLKLLLIALKSELKIHTEPWSHWRAKIQCFLHCTWHTDMSYTQTFGIIELSNLNWGANLQTQPFNDSQTLYSYHWLESEISFSNRPTTNGRKTTTNSVESGGSLESERCSSSVHFVIMWVVVLQRGTAIRLSPFKCWSRGKEKLFNGQTDERKQQHAWHKQPIRSEF